MKDFKFEKTGLKYKNITIPSYYNEEGQTSSVRFQPVWFNPETKELYGEHKPFKCREYLSDWILHVNCGATGNIYGFCCNNKDMYNKKLVGNKYILVYVSSLSEAKVLKSLSIDSYTKGDTYIFLFEYPDYAKDSPFGVLIFSLSLRAYVEVVSKYGKTELLPYFNFVNSDDTTLKSVRIIRNFVGNFGHERLQYLSEHTEYFWKVPKTSSLNIDEDSHSYNSPIVLTTPFMTGLDKVYKILDNSKSSMNKASKQQLLYLYNMECAMLLNKKINPDKELKWYPELEKVS